MLIILQLTKPVSHVSLPSMTTLVLPGAFVATIFSYNTHKQCGALFLFLLLFSEFGCRDNNLHQSCYPTSFSTYDSLQAVAMEGACIVESPVEDKVPGGGNMVRFFKCSYTAGKSSQRV